MFLIFGNILQAVVFYFHHIFMQFLAYYISTYFIFQGKLVLWLKENVKTSGAHLRILISKLVDVSKGYQVA